MDDRIAEIKSRLQAITPGTWLIRESDDDDFEDADPTVVTVEGLYIAQTSYDGLSYTIRPTMHADAEFIAHAKDDIEFLLRQLEVCLGK